MTWVTGLHVGALSPYSTGMSEHIEEPTTEADDELDALLARARESALRTLDEHVDARLREVLAQTEVDPGRINRGPR